jgi:hypothetical protein
MVATSQTDGNGRVGELLHRISDDIKVIARDELELVKGELGHTAKVAAGESAAIVLGGEVALIGLGMLCSAAVVALGAVIPSLALRLVIMAFAYLIIGGAIAVIFLKRLRRDIIPDTSVAGYEAKRTVAGVKHTLHNAERPTHA